MAAFENYYRILDVPYNASLSKIKEAYRQKVKEVHPDKQKGNAEQFKRVKEAYEILSDLEKRKRYDNLFFKKAQFVNHNQEQESPLKMNPTINIISIQRRKRKQDTVLPLMVNAAVILIGILGKAYLKRK
jgi:curved DNA-binding protein CbpA